MLIHRNVNKKNKCIKILIMKILTYKKTNNDKANIYQNINV